MRKALSIAAVAGLSLVLSAGAAMAGDTCAGATALLEGITGGDLGGGSSQWYSFSPGGGADFAINTNYAGTEFVASLAVFGSCGGALLDSNEGSFERNAHLRMPLDGGQTYYIQVSRGDSGTSGGTAFQVGVNQATVGVCPGTGDCWDANGTPGCNDQCGGGLPSDACPGCCDTICAIDPFCCTNNWDTLCEAQAESICVPVPVELQSIDVERR